MIDLSLTWVKFWEAAFIFHTLKQLYLKCLFITALIHYKDLFIVYVYVGAYWVS